MRSHLDHFCFALLFLLSLTLALLVGDIVFVRARPSSPLQITDDMRVRVPVSSSAASVTIIEVPIPAGMQFVASRNGKKYYPVLSPAAERLIPKNRVYFRTAAEAERAGYQE